MGEKQLVNYMTLKEASEYTRIPVPTLRKRVTEGVLRAFKPGKNLLFSREDIDRFMKRFTL